MAEMLVRLFNKYEGEDSKLISKSTGRGDVIVAVEDGWNWSEIERTSYNWIIINCPAALSKCRTLRTPEQGDRFEDPYLWILAFYLDLDILISLGHTIPFAEDAKIGKANNSKRPTASITITEAEFDLAKVLKSKIENPAVIG